MYRPKYHITPHFLNMICEASYLRSWLKHTNIQVSWLPILQKEAQLRSAHSSTAIEGNPLSYHQVKALDRGEKAGSHRSHEKEIMNYLRAMHYLERNAGQKISEKTVFQLHEILMRDLTDDNKLGKYKTKQNHIVAVKELLSWFNSKNAHKLHSILVCAIFHHRFVSIHPFSDGNGRLARTLSTLILYQREFDNHHIFSLDEFFAEDRKHYYQKLQQARELDDDLTMWLDYVAEGVVNTLKDVKKRVEDMQVYSTTRITISPRQEEVLRIMRDVPLVRGRTLQKTLSISRARVNQLISPLVKHGLIIQEGKRRGTKYRLAFHQP